MCMYAEVAVNSGVPHHQAFSYAIPDGMAVRPGSAVYVPFGRRTLQGIVVSLGDLPAYGDVAAVRPIAGLIEERPLLSEAHIALARWISDYYLAPLFDAVSLMLPPGFERRPLTLLRSSDGAVSPDLSAADAELLAVLHEEGASEMEALRPRFPDLTRRLRRLERAGLVVREYALARPGVSPKEVAVARLLIAGEQALAHAVDAEARRWLRVARALRLLATRGEVPVPTLRQESGIDAAGLRTLASSGLVALEVRRLERDPLSGRHYPLRPAPALTADQEAAAAEIERALAAGGTSPPFLLHGVTGSGKTEVYLRALATAVAMGRRGIVLVPEIALTPQTVRRFAERFPGRVAVLHSGLSAGERFDQWYAVRDGRYDVVVGSRSALFAPQPDLGLLIIDEEHEWTYKQSDPQPRYHAREAAETLARLIGAVLVLGSATPDVVSYRQAERGRYRLLTLARRVRPLEEPEGRRSAVAAPGLPQVQVVDLREELRAGNRGIFSRALRTALAQTLGAGEQAILFLNRRGAAAFLQCRDCGHVPECSSCAMALSYHREPERLLCHQCNRRRRPPRQCPACGSARIRQMGIGVERVEEETRRLFPQARVVRWDRDVTRGKGAHERILEAFLAHEADVLVGTQMLAKGLDLPAVTLVGVVSADVALHLPDFRAAERTFQLVTQVAGRAGRADRLGRVVVQTYTPDHYAIDAASRHDFASFYKQEVELRRRSGYPPFQRLVRLLFAHTNAAFAQREVMRLATMLNRQRDVAGSETTITGPSPAYVARVRGRWRWQLLLRGRDPTDLVRNLRLPPGWTVDVDPVAML